MTSNWLAEVDSSRNIRAGIFEISIQGSALKRKRLVVQSLTNHRPCIGYCRRLMESVGSRRPSGGSLRRAQLTLKDHLEKDVLALGSWRDGTGMVQRCITCSRY